MEGANEPPRAYVPFHLAVKSSQPRVNVKRNFGAKLLLFFDIASYLQKNMYLCNDFSAFVTIIM